MYEMFESSEDNQLLFDAYHLLDNYRIEKTGSVSGRCYIFFTSHGLYFPTTAECFKHKVLEQDYYEWVNISKSEALQKSASEFIFVRDIYKNWCLNGINSNYNTIDKLYGLLKKLIKGRPVITVGSSAGGFMAILFGTLLKAQTIYAFSPQVSLSRYHAFHPIKYYREYVKDPCIMKYMELSPFIKEYEGNLYYFYPNECPEDIDQYEDVKGLEHVHFFSINNSQHGVTFYGDSIIRVISMPASNLNQLEQIYKDKKVSPDVFLIRTSGLVKGSAIIVGKKIKKLIHMNTR